MHKKHIRNILLEVVATLLLFTLPSSAHARASLAPITHRTRSVTALA